MTKLGRPVFWALATAVLVLSLLPQETPLPSTGWDKTNHLFGYLVLAVSAMLAYPHRPLWITLGLVAFGGAIEIAQGLTGYRFAEWLDFVANGIGVGLGVGLWMAWRGLPGNRALESRGGSSGYEG